MTRPPKPLLTGIHTGGGNRFSWDFGRIPSPKRSMTVLVPADLDTGGRHANVAIPVICDWCGLPFWPPWQILQGCCSEVCREALQQYLTDRHTKAQVLEQLGEQFQSEQVTIQDLEVLLKELRAHIAEEQAENDRLRGELGKRTYA